MEKKKFWKSKRFWGIVTCAVAKLLPVIAPETQAISGTILNAGELLFGIGCIDAKKPVGF